MQELILDGITYVPLKIASAETGYERNYLGQLCRAGKVDGRLVGRNWYINLDSLQEHTSLDYGHRGTTGFVQKQAPSKATVFPATGSSSTTSMRDNLTSKNIAISSANVTEHKGTASACAITPIPVPSVVAEELASISKTELIPILRTSHTQPAIDLTNLLPPPPKSETLVTPRVRPISRYFNEDSGETVVPVAPQSTATPGTSTLQEDVELLKREREKRAHQYITSSQPTITTRIDPLPAVYQARSVRRGGTAVLEWFVPGVVATLAVVAVAAASFFSLELLSKSTFASGADQTATSPLGIFELLLERRVEYK